MKKRLFTLVLSAGFRGSLQATNMTYEETGFMSGTINGMAFSNTVTLVTLADSANIAYTLYGGQVPYWSVAGLTTIAIHGFGNATFNGAQSIGAISLDLSVVGGLPLVGIARLGDVNTILGNYDSSPTFDLNTAATLSGPTTMGGFSTYSTTLGDLVTTGFAGSGSFISTPTSVPEPSTEALFGLGVTGLLIARRRRKAVQILD
jgi:hypothetical protein